MTAAVATSGKMTTVASVTTTVASAVTTTVAAAAVSSACLGRHVGCGHHHTGGSGSREAINSGQGPEGQQFAQSHVRHASSVRLTHSRHPLHCSARHSEEAPLNER
jgi:hypothetical protein